MIVERGRGDPVVVVPGVQGRWQWMAPAIDALSARARVVTYSLAGEPDAGWRLRASDTFDVHSVQLDEVFNQAGLEAAALVGVSFGGWVALRYAARRRERVRALVLASTPGPHFQPDLRQQRYMRSPLLTSPLFLIGATERMRVEVMKALPDPHARWRFTRGQLSRMAKAPASPAMMARRVKLALHEDFGADCGAVTAPTLVLTGESGLDRVVPVTSSDEYVALIPHAERASVPSCGHLGLVTRPEAWADEVVGFLSRHGGLAAPRAEV